MYEIIPIVLIALLLDVTFGDVKTRYHPTAWIGRLIAWYTRLLKPLANQRLAGVILVCLAVLVPIITLGLFDYTTSLFSNNFYTGVVIIFVSAILLKTTFAIRGMHKHAMLVLSALKNNDLKTSRNSLAMIVKRDTSTLDSQHILSGVLESISENIVDGITAPLFYFGLFGLPGAFTYRCINTLDSMIGYNNKLFAKFGWFAAKCDGILNYIPSRLTCGVMIISSILLGYDWRGAYSIMIRDAKNTESLNAGYPMATLAGALGVQLEKSNHYSLGDDINHISIQHVQDSIKIMILTSILFCGMIVIPLALFLSYIGWWLHV